jgi:hypothetical protein
MLNSALLAESATTSQQTHTNAEPKTDTPKNKCPNNTLFSQQTPLNQHSFLTNTEAAKTAYETVEPIIRGIEKKSN